MRSVLVTPGCKDRHMRYCQGAEEYGGRGLIPQFTWFGRDAGLTAQGGGCVNFNVVARPQNSHKELSLTCLPVTRGAVRESWWLQAGCLAAHTTLLTGCLCTDKFWFFS